MNKRNRLLFALLLSGCCCVRGLSDGEEIDAQHWQLFIDNYAIARGTGLDRSVHHPKAMGIVIPNDKPWETKGLFPSYFARKPDGTFVCYYTSIWWDPKPEAKVQGDRASEYVLGEAYATSRDGVHWLKPSLGLIEAPTGVDWKKSPPFPCPTGSGKENNLGVPFSFQDLGSYGNVTDPARRFAILYQGKAYFAAEIPDFIHDSDWRGKLVPAGGTFSPRGAQLNFWDSIHGEWVAIVQNAVPHWLPTRQVARFASKDLKVWRSEIVLAADPEDPHRPDMYDETMGMYPYYADGVVFGLIGWFHSDRSTPDGGPVTDLPPGPRRHVWPWPRTRDYPYNWPWARKGVCEARITISRDGGHTWDRTCSRQAWIPNGTEEDSYDRYVGALPPVRVGNEDWFYAIVFDGNHLSTRADAAQRPYYHDRLSRSQVALYVQKHDRYVSLHTGSQAETLITKPFVVKGDTLQLNVDATRGQVRVGIAEYKPVLTLNDTTYSTAPHLMERNVLPGFTRKDCLPIEANSTEYTVQFKKGASLREIQGRTVVLFIEISDADLYGFRVH